MTTSSEQDTPFVYPDDIVAIARRNYFHGDSPHEAAQYLFRMGPAEIGRAAMHIIDIHYQLSVGVEHCGLVAAASSPSVRRALGHAEDMSAILLQEDIDQQIQERMPEIVMHGLEIWAGRDFGSFEPEYQILERDPSS